VFDGRYVYFIPSIDGFAPPSQSNLIPRYDTTGDFEAASSWTYYDNTTAPGGFGGGTFDGRFVYFVGVGGTLTRYDTFLQFSNPSSWSTVDVSSVASTDGLGFTGAVFDGRYLYALPGDYASQPAVARFDTMAENIDSQDAWSVFNTAQIVDPVGGHYGYSVGGAYDGRYLYVASTNGAPLLRYDATKDFSASSSWEKYASNLAVINQRDFYSDGGANFDGTAVFFFGFVLNGDSTVSELALRFDISGSFTNNLDWNVFDLSSFDFRLSSQYGSVFDGRYLYSEPGYPNGAFVRFDSRMPAQEPSIPDFHGSFL
jgi:hypothetical protein